MSTAVAFDVDTAALRTLAGELRRLAGLAGADTPPSTVFGPPVPARSGAQSYLDRYVHVPAGSAGLNPLFADISTYVSGRAADFAAYLRQLQAALAASATNLDETAALYESVDDEQRAALDGLAAEAFGNAVTRPKSLPADGYQPQCVRVPLAQMVSGPVSEAPGGEYGLVEQILTTEWTSPSALVLQAIGECFEVEPLAFVTSCFGGDWAQVDIAAQAADALAWCFDAIGDNIADATRGCRELWTGPAADAAFEYLGRLATAARDAGEAATDVADRLHKVAKAMFSACEQVAALFATAMDCIGAGIVTAGLGGATATTAVGPALAALVEGLLAARAFAAVVRAVERTQELVSLAEAAVDQLTGIAAQGTPNLPSVSIPLPGSA